MLTDVGGLTLISPLTIEATPWVGALFVLLAILVTLLSARISRK